MSNQGWLDIMGFVQKIEVAVANGETSKAIDIKSRPNAKYTVLTDDNYGSGAYITSKTKSGFTLNYADPKANKIITCIIM